MFWYVGVAGMQEGGVDASMQLLKPLERRDMLDWYQRCDLAHWENAQHSCGPMVANGHLQLVACRPHLHIQYHTKGANGVCKRQC